MIAIVVIMTVKTTYFKINQRTMQIEVTITSQVCLLGGISGVPLSVYYGKFG